MPTQPLQILPEPTLSPPWGAFHSACSGGISGGRTYEKLKGRTGASKGSNSISVQLRQGPAGGQGWPGAVHVQWLCFQIPSQDTERVSIQGLRGTSRPCPGKSDTVSDFLTMV